MSYTVIRRLLAFWTMYNDGCAVMLSEETQSILSTGRCAS